MGPHDANVIYYPTGAQTPMNEGVTCTRCGASTPLPADLQTPSFHCSACNGELATAQYLDPSIASAEQFRLYLQNPHGAPVVPKGVGGDLRRQLAGNQALKDLHAKGVACHRCGANNPIADPAAVQVVCAYCGAAILLSDHVSADAVARARIRQGMVAMRDNAVAAKKTEERRALFIVLGLFGLAAIGITIAGLMGVLH